MRFIWLKCRYGHEGSRKTDERLKPRVFGYANRTGFSSALPTACAAAGVEYLSPHQAGRHGFYTELRVRQGLDPVTAAKAGRWAGTALPEKTYAHSEAEEAAMRAAIRGSAEKPSIKGGLNDVLAVRTRNRYSNLKKLER